MRCGFLRRRSGVVHVAAEVNLNSKSMEHGGLDSQGFVGGRRIGRVGDADVVGAVASHEGVARDAVKDGVYERPLIRGLMPAAFGLFLRQFDDGAAAEIGMEAA